jgi:hypothetical protein
MVFPPPGEFKLGISKHLLKLLLPLRQREGGGTPDLIVYVVGFVRTSAGGALKAVARPVWCLMAVLRPFDGGVLWSTDVERPLSPCPQLPGAAGCALPWPDLGRRIWHMKMSKKMVLLGSLTTVASEVGPPGRAQRIPVRWGSASVPR